MSHTNFPVHGSFNVSIKGRLLVINGEGPGNVEMARRYREAVAPYREQLSGQPWASLVILYGLPLFPPEAKSFMQETITQIVKKTDIVATGVVFKEVEYENAIKPFWEEIYQNAKLPYLLSDDEEAVTEWLLKQIDEANHRQSG